MSVQSENRNDQLLSDLNFAAKLAKDGAQAPLLGGPFLLVWSGLLIPTLLAHGAILDGLISISTNKISMMWLLYGVLGGVLSLFLGVKRKTKPGNNSLLNRLSRTSGITLSVLIFCFAVVVSIGVSQGKLAPDTFNFILPFAFGMQAMQLVVLGYLSQKAYLIKSGYIAGLSMGLTLFFNTSNEVYYIAAASVLLTMTLPGYLEMKKEKFNG